MKTDSEIVRQIREIIRKRDDFATERLLKLAQDVVTARHYQGDDGWDRLKEAIGQLEDFIRPETPRDEALGAD